MIRIIITISTLMLLYGCSDLVDGINDDPNNLTTSSYQNILTGTEVGNILLQSGEAARRSGIFAGQYTGIDRQHQGYSQYAVTTSDFDGLWNDAYVNAYRNALITEQAATEENVGPVTIGITRVLQAQIIGTTASLYGNIPVKEAGVIEITNPVFEAQEAVYRDVQDLLDRAIVDLSETTGRPVSGSDIYYNGDPQPWMEAAYTLKARFFMHTKAYDEAYDAALQGISTPANSMYGPHGTAADNSNLNYQFFAVEVRQADLVVSDFMASLVDPSPESPDPANYRGNAKTDETARFHYYFEKNSTGIQPNTEDGFAAQQAGSPLVTYEENLLILAESGYRSQGFGAGLDHLNTFRSFMDNGGYMTDANPEALLYAPYTEADFESGGIENPDGISRNDALLREILEERYITLFGQIEPFNDTRRTLNEAGVRVPIIPNRGDRLPARFLYPQSEIDRNDNIPSPIPDFFEPTPVNE